MGGRERWFSRSILSIPKFHFADVKQKLQYAVKLMIDNGTLNNIMNKYYMVNIGQINQ
jgi:hypothetical protein